MSSPPIVRVLLVDDFEAFRDLIRSTLEGNLQVVGEAQDGLEAVQKAQELQPDLILLDIGLPVLNGIEAARQIREFAPHSKILFLSQESSPDVIEEALRYGVGYIVKTEAGTDLVAAIEALRAGEQFARPTSQLILLPPSSQNDKEL